MAAGDQSSYSDSQYGVEKVLAFGFIDLAVTNGLKAEVKLAEDITITEFGAVNIVGNSGISAAVLLLQDSGTTIATMTFASHTTAGQLNRVSSITSATAITSGDYLGVRVNASSGSLGTVSVYVKYNQNFIAA